ncbi:MAG: hypothetical protein GIW98_06605 [Candidatus Eremiobacteraeota bacterium]|nr:hypothetical protein [Candidatus Eremiobacteraeota bacterium]
MNRLFSALCVLSISVVAFATGWRNLQATPAAAQPQAQASLTPPPPPPPLPRETSPVTVPIAPAKPEGSPTAQASVTPTASPTPASNRKTLDGVWEVQVQRRDDTSYAHFNLVQQASTLTGTYMQDGKNAPLAGTLDGNAIRIVVTRSDGTTVIFSGSVDGKTDMIGMMQTGTENTPFTAAYRPKVKLIERAITGQ